MSTHVLKVQIAVTIHLEIDNSKRVIYRINIFETQVFIVNDRQHCIFIAISPMRQVLLQSVNLKWVLFNEPVLSLNTLIG